MREVLLCKFCDNITSPKSTLKEHTPMIHTGEKLLYCTLCGNLDSLKSTLKEHHSLSHSGEMPSAACFVATWSVRSPNLKNILKCSIQERIPSLQELWPHYPTELQPEGAYSNDPYWRETILCKFCGSMATLKCELMDHNQLSNEENSFLTNKLWWLKHMKV